MPSRRASAPLTELTGRRVRIGAALARASRFPITLLVAPAGSGKTTALREFAASIGGCGVWFEVGPTHTTLPRFVRGLAAALAAGFPEVPQSLSIAHERATQSSRPADVLAAWLAEHLRAAPRTVVIDNYHRCEHDPAIAALLAGVIDRTRPQTRWVVATRFTNQLPFAKWFARGDADVPVGETALTLAADDALAFAAEVAPVLDARAVVPLNEALGGCIGYLRAAFDLIERRPAIVGRLLRAGAGAQGYCVEQLLALLDAEQRRFLGERLFCADAEAAWTSPAGRTGGASTIEALRRAIPLAFERDGSAARFTPFFVDVLRERIAASDADFIVAAHAQAGRVLEGANRVAEAVGHYILGRNFGALSRLLDSHGFALSDVGLGDVVQDAIDALDPIARAASPVILALRATFESRRGRFDPAQSYFAPAIERAPDAAMRNHIMYQYGTHLVRFMRPESIELLESLVASTAPSDDLHGYGRSALGPAYVLAGRFDEALASAAAAVRLTAQSANQHLRARVFHQAAYVALYRDDAARAKRFAARSLAIAQARGYFDIAAGALTVLYNVASDLEDDPLQSLRILDDVARCAAKSGSLPAHFTAMVAKLEIQVERGDGEAIEELDVTLRALDAAFGGSAAYEALVAAQAIRAGWNGDYAGAYRLLVSSTEQQWSADRKALRWAEVAVYAAAGGLHAEASAAVDCCRDFLALCRPAHRTVRARLFLALAMILSARSEAAREMLALADTDPHAASPRLRALRNAFAALWERYRGVRNQAALLAAFAALEQQHFGGVARLVLNFPLADNASLRLGELSLPERRVLAKLERLDGFVSERQVERVLAKLGCIDAHTALRAVARQPFALRADTLS